MNKILKVTGVFILGLGLLTGCSEKVAVKDSSTESAIITKETVKEKNDNKQEVENNVKENQNVESANNVANTTTNEVASSKTVQNNKNSATAKNTINYADIRATLNIWEYSKFNLEGNNIGHIVQHFATSGVNGSPKVVSMANVVDKLNTYNKGVYNQTDVLSLLRNNKGVSFVEMNDSVKNYTATEQKELVKGNKIIYMKKDNAFLTAVVSGLGGATDSVFETEDNWEVVGDKVIVNYVNVVTNKKTAIMTLKANTKNYVGGANKTAYYVESFVYL